MSFLPIAVLIIDTQNLLMPHESPHRLIDLLPAIFRRSEELEAFLVPFEAALFEPGGGGGGDHGSTSVEGQIGRIPSLLDADDTDEEFLPWLAQWAAISLYWEAEDRRRLRDRRLGCLRDKQVASVPSLRFASRALTSLCLFIK